jgi:hypothetical protein
MTLRQSNLISFNGAWIGYWEEIENTDVQLYPREHEELKRPSASTECGPWVPNRLRKGSSSPRLQPSLQEWGRESYHLVSLLLGYQF